MNGYELSRNWFNFCFENPEKITPLHTALYLFAVEHCNRLGWKQKFGLPTEMVKEAIGVKSWHTYIRAFNDLVDWNFFILVEKSKNQYSSNIIALSKSDEALDEALDEAIAKHLSKQLRSTYQSNDSIIKLITNNIKLLNDKEDEFKIFIDSIKPKKKLKESDSEIILTPLEIKFNEFLLFRKQIKKPIVKASEEAFKKKLYDLSGQNEDMAIKILDQSIANGWQGIFEIKTNNNGSSNNNSGISKQSERIKQNLATAARVLAKLNGTGT